MLDCVIVGAGPAGLTAAVYLARFRRSVLVVHDGSSRALRIPRTYNVPGFPDGIAGADLVFRMTDQARKYHVEIERCRIERVERFDDKFSLSGQTGNWDARTVILATGISLNEVELPTDIHEQAIATGCLRYCPICDGYEASGRKIGVLGGDDRGAKEALFLRNFSDDVTLVGYQGMALSDHQRQELIARGIRIVDPAVTELGPSGDRMEVQTADGQAISFDVLYPALGCQPRSDLARPLEVQLTSAGCIPTDATQHTNIRGVFAAGDVVEAMDQISVAIGHGAIAATHAHRFLSENEPLL